LFIKRELGRNIINLIQLEVIAKPVQQVVLLNHRFLWGEEAVLCNGCFTQRHANKIGFLKTSLPKNSSNYQKRNRYSSVYEQNAQYSERILLCFPK